MAVLRVRDDVICLQTLLWPDEVHEADLPVLDTAITLRPQELTMASSLVESLASDFDPSAFEDTYQAALESLIEAKVAARGAQGVPDEGEAAAAGEPPSGGEVIDLLSALQRSVEKARAARGEPVQTSKPAPAARRARSATTRSAARSVAAGDGAGDDSRTAAQVTSASADTAAARKARTKVS
ncbi:MAG TPA: Ku protein, partial [Cellulomonas sp.]|nr:Ku protein [Cellulomonas sp.]